MDPPPGSNPPPLRAHLLGPVRLALGDRPLAAGDWPRRSARSLLLLLLATPCHRLPRERALDLLWPEAAPDAARNALSVALHGLRRTLEPGMRAGRASAYVEAGGEELRLRPHAGCWIDADAFEAALAAADGVAAPERQDHLRRALALYRGDLLADELSVDWPVARREALRTAWRRSVLDLANIEREIGRPLAPLPELERVLAADPTDEAALRALMRSLAAAGRPEEAQRQFERCVRALRAEFAVEPAPETTALAATLTNPPKPTAPALAPAPAASRYDNLPAPPNPLVGRDRELEALQELLWDPTVRLVTVTGAGGSGKTRLALEAARHVAADFADGACWVPLAPLRDPALVLSTIARTLGVADLPGRSVLDALQRALRARRVLVVIDNVEQVAAAAADLAELLSACPGLTLLATSRQPLHLRAEHQFPTPPLAVPPQDAAGGDRFTAAAAARYEAVALFVQRTRAVNPGFALTDDNAATVATVCARLDGLPLAIELAAARGRQSAPAELLAGLSDRFALLAAGYHDLPARQRTMRAAVAWSHDLLSQAERVLFRRLAVFVGGFTAEAAEAVAPRTDERPRDQTGSPDRGVREHDGPPPGSVLCPRSSVLGLLTALLDHSLLHRSEDVPGGTRFALLETIRDYGLDVLAANGETDVVRDAHATFFRELAERAGPELDGPNATTWLDLLETEHANLRAAMSWCVDRGDAVAALRVAVGVSRFWESRGHIDEGRAWLDRALAAEGEVPLPLRASAFQSAAALAGSQDDADLAEALHRQALAIQRQLGDMRGAARSLARLGRIARMRGDDAAGEHLLREALAIGRELGDRRGVANALNELGMAAVYRGDLDLARELYEEALAGYRHLRDGDGTAHVLNSLADLAGRRADHDEARRLGEEARRLFRELGDVRGLAATLLNLGDAYTRLGDPWSALAPLEEAIALGRDHGLKRSLAIALFNQANALQALGHDAKAAPRWTESLALLVGLEDRALLAEAVDELSVMATGMGQPARAALLRLSAERLRTTRAAADTAHPRTTVDDLIDAIRSATGIEPIAAAREPGESLPIEQAVAQALTADLGGADDPPRSA